MARSLQLSAPDLQPFQSRLREACRSGRLDQVQELIATQRRHAAPGQKLEFGAALHESSSHGHFHVTLFLLKEGAEVDALHRDGRTPPPRQLNSAEEGERCEANLPVSRGVGKGSARGLGPLRKKARCVSVDTGVGSDNKRESCSVKDRFSSDSDVKRQSDCIGTAFLRACKAKSTEAVELLLNAGAHVDVQGENQNTPLILAAKTGELRMMRLLLKSGNLGHSAVNRIGENGRTALHYACDSECGGTARAVQWLLNAGARLDIKDHFQLTPLLLALKDTGGDEDIVGLLLKHDSLGSTVNIVDKDGQTALHYACKGGSSEAVELLLNAGAHVDIRDQEKVTPLMLLAMHNGALDVVRKLLLKSDNLSFALSSTSKYGLTALHFACRGVGSAETIRLLLNAGAHVSVNLQDHCQRTPLMCASGSGNSEAVKLLILHGADVNIERASEPSTALSFAASGNHTECGILLVEGGANVHLPDVQSAMSEAKPSFKDAVTQAMSFQTKKAICVVGNAITGKSTLVASLKKGEVNVLGKLWNYWFGSSGVSQRTAGIEPVPLNSKRFGSVMFFDFAGQQEYHGPHNLFLNAILSRGLSTVTAIVVVKATEEGPAIVDQLNRWLYPLSQASVAVSNPVRIIAVASHIDKVKRVTGTKKKLESAYEDTKQAYAGAPLQFMGLVCLNCCLSYSEGIDKLCQYLNDVPFPKYKTEDVGYSIPWIISRIRSEIKDKVISVADFSTWIAECRDNLPTNLPDSHIVCRDLSATGHFLYLPNGRNLAKGWLVLDLPCILHEVYGTVFPPSPRSPTADQFGLVAITTLADLFPAWKTDLICDILIALEFAIKVDSTMCRELKGLSSGSEEDSNEIYPQHLFVPALVSSQRTNIFMNLKSNTSILRWLFHVNSQSYFTPFLLQSIIHCVTLKHVSSQEQGSLTSKYQCRVWYNGIFWQTSSVDIAVQVSDSSVLQVIATSDTSAEELFKDTTAVIGDISSTIHKLSPGMSGSSYIIYPGEPQTLLENPRAPSPLHMFPVKFLLDSLKKNQTTCLSLMDGDCPATRMSIPSLFCGFQPTADGVSGLLLLNPLRSSGDVESPEQLQLNALQTLPQERELRSIADNCGSNWKRLLSYVGLKSATIHQLEIDGNTSSDACFAGLVLWLGGNVKDSDPVNWSTLLTAMEEADMTADAGEWRQKIVERSQASEQLLQD